MKKLGVIVNPVAGMGGRVGLKGSDGAEILRRARELGAEPESPRRAVEALKAVSKLKAGVEVITYPAEMGEGECREAGLDPEVIGTIMSGATTAADTQDAAREMAAAGVDLILFAGGDGTARNIEDAVGTTVPVLGIPAGVKIHSAVYAVTPGSAGKVAAMFLEGRLPNTKEAEVMDIDEEAFRKGVVSAKLYGYLLVPEEKRFVQSVKSGGIRVEQEALHGMAANVIKDMEDEDDCYYIIGPGTTTRVIMDRLGLENTLLGVDVVRGKELVASDVAEEKLMNIIRGNKARIVVTAIGGQGHIFGRGNQQLSPAVLRHVGTDNIIIIATKEKLVSLDGRPLLVDTGDEELNADLSGYIRVTTGFKDYTMYKVGY
ncbi:MAG: ATP-NAD kinase family protein [Candidatus Abyssubacteria bacterium]|nr:ATP-NAD kinase family protein [Candidatus Abyssubacteria bacterium]